jgi:hypothetical protein
MKLKSTYIYILTSSLLIASCGGGGGGGGGAPVPPVLAAVISTFTSTSSSTEIGSTVDISWSTTNASSCNASGAWSGSKGTSGTETVTIETVGNNIFTLTCTGAGGNANRNLTIEGYRNFSGISVDGYVSGASIFIDANENYMMDSGESETSSAADGSFTLKYGNGVLVSLGGQDIDTQTQLTGLMLLRSLNGYSDDSFMVTPVTSVSHFIPSKDINDVLGIDSSIDVFTTDPVANLNNGASYELLYEKGNQLTVLAYSLQNITNDINNSSDSTADYFKAISEEISLTYDESSLPVNIEKSVFIEKVIDNLITAKSLTIDAANKNNAVKALSAVIPVIGVKSTNDLTASVIRFSTNKFQDDFLKIVQGTADQDLITSYSSDVLNYIAKDQNVNVADIQPQILAFADSISLEEDGSITFSPTLNDELTPGTTYSISVSSASNGTVNIAESSPEQITYKPSTNFNGQDSFTYSITQGNLSDSATVSVTITSVNDAPTIDLASTVNYAENTTDTIDTGISDVDGDELTITLSGTDSESFKLSNNLLSFVTSPDYETKDSYSLTLTVTDGVLTVEKTITIKITDVNESVGYKVPTSIDVIETKD